MEEEEVGSPVDMEVTDDEEDAAAEGGTGTTDSDGDEDDVDEVPEQKFLVRQKVYARDDKASGVLYE